LAHSSLITEGSHPKTTALSHLAQADLLQAYALLAELDHTALDRVSEQAEKIKQLQAACFHVMDRGGRVMLVGCGASGRIAAQIEHDWRFTQPNQDALISVLAGGDISLIESVEACEDRPEYAVAQLEALALSAADIVIALSAGGESPFILGALRYAQTITQAEPWFLYCNPDALLLERHAEHPVGQAGFALLNLTVGPMALMGSTRMQATTALTFALMEALFPLGFDGKRWRAFYEKLDWSLFLPLTEWEAACHQRQEAVVYEVEAALAMPVLADMTERSPTFNLPAFPNQQDAAPILFQYVLLSDVVGGQQFAWEALLSRPVRAFSNRIYGFDLSMDALDFLKKIQPKIQMLRIIQKTSFLEMSFSGQKIALDLPDLSLLEIAFLLRLICVNHSTLMMGRLGYYHGNLMTNLKPSNAKLVDRAIRFVLFLYEQEAGVVLDYNVVAKKLSEILPGLKPQESIVFRLLSEIKTA
jgi:N-acetylmuramic acid 6-phosphate etherase